MKKVFRIEVRGTDANVYFDDGCRIDVPSRLIIAAPDMYAALQAMIEAYEHEAAMDNPALLAARAAIAKAEEL